MKTYKIVKELGAHGEIVWVIKDPDKQEHIAFYYTLRACIGHLMTLGKIVSKKMTKPGHYTVNVKIIDMPAQSELGRLLR